MSYKDYYSILGVDRGASSEEIQRAYRNLARKYHPDVNTEVGAEDRFKELGEAYAVLKGELKDLHPLPIGDSSTSRKASSPKRVSDSLKGAQPGTTVRPPPPVTFRIYKPSQSSIMARNMLASAYPI